MTRIKKEEVRENRIAMEAVVDAYDECERAMGWYYYLDEKIKFPFTAHCQNKRPISPLKVGEEVEVIGMAQENECQSDMFVWIRYSNDQLAVPLAQLASKSTDVGTQEAMGDWHYWVAREYEF